MWSKRFVYNKIELKEATVKAYGDTAVLIGKAKFTVNGEGSIIWFIPLSIFQHFYGQIKRQYTKRLKLTLLILEYLLQ